MFEYTHSFRSFLMNMFLLSNPYKQVFLRSVCEVCMMNEKTAEEKYYENVKEVEKFRLEMAEE